MNNDKAIKMMKEARAIIVELVLRLEHTNRQIRHSGEHTSTVLNNQEEIKNASAFLAREEGRRHTRDGGKMRKTPRDPCHIQPAEELVMLNTSTIKLPPYQVNRIIAEAEGWTVRQACESDHIHVDFFVLINPSGEIEHHEDLNDGSVFCVTAENCWYFVPHFYRSVDHCLAVCERRQMSTEITNMAIEPWSAYVDNHEATADTAAAALSFALAKAIRASKDRQN